MFSPQIVLLLLVSLGQISCQTDYKQGRKIPQWGTGLIAVAVFLVLVFMAYMGRKVWNRKSKDLNSMEKSTDVDDGTIPNGTFHRHNGLREHQHAYENPAAEFEDDNVLTTPM